MGAQQGAHSGRADTLDLLVRARNGDKDAEEALIQNNLALVHSVARRFRDRGVEYDDLFQIGCLGFVKAIKNFDTSYNVRFSTYAVPMIMGEIRRFLRDDGPLKVSRTLKEKASELMAAQERLSARLQREPTLAELCAETGIAPEDMAQVMEALSPVASVDAEIGSGDGTLQLADRIADEHEHPDTQINRLLIKELLQTLDARERSIIIMRYFQERTQSEVAREIGVSQVQISRLETRILAKLRASVDAPQDL